MSLLPKAETDSSQPCDIVISESDIEEIALTFGWNFGEHHYKVLTCKTTQDVQACPGSGKTTLLVAKLAILAKKWQWGDRGICVLSHTNVARKEIEKRLATDPSGCRLLDYPHFIGTIQVFIDQFLAYPFLRNKGVDVTTVDDDRFTKRALRHFEKEKQSLYFLHQRPHQGKAIVSGLRYSTYDGEKFKIISRGGDIPQAQKTYGALLALKKTITAEGICCYEDMVAFAEAYVHDYPQIIEYIRIRFPWVFIDEMQDTDPRQNALLTTLWDEKCIVQRLGDINQAIYGDEGDYEAGVDFPRNGYLDLPISQRFGQEIATFASMLTARQRQAILGNAKRSATFANKKRHTIFLFDSGTVRNVLNQFAILLSDIYPHPPTQEFVAKAIGFRKSDPGSSSDKNFPKSLGSYWSDFQPNGVNKSQAPEYLIDFVRQARHLREEQNELREAYDILIRGVLEFLHRQHPAYYPTGKRRITRPQFFAIFDEFEEQVKQCFYELLFDWCFPNTELTDSYWEQSTQVLLSVCNHWIRSGLQLEAEEFLSWGATTQCTISTSRLSKDLINTYVYNEYTYPIKIELATIHAVKGETHDATLIVETFFDKTHDLPMLLPYLCGEGDYQLLQTDKKLFGHMKRIFVAMTRPKDLVCLAINKNHITADQVEKLKCKGWEIVYLESDPLL